MNKIENVSRFDVRKHSVIAQRHGVVMQGAEIGLGADNKHMAFALDDLSEALHKVDFPAELLAELDNLHANKKTITGNDGRPASRADLGWPRTETKLIRGQIYLIRRRTDIINQETEAFPEAAS